MSFKSYLEEQEFVEFLFQEFNQNPVHDKPWSAKKPEILQMWKNLRPGIPIYMTPMVKNGPNSHSYAEDGVRINGSWQFISAILSRIKDIMAYENPNTKLRLSFRGVDKEHDPTQSSFVFYIHCEPRAQ
jgi:hypothetical protein